MTSSSLRLAVLCALGSAAVQAAVKPNVLFSDHAVFQQGMSVPVWGTAASGEDVTVEFAGQKKTAKAGPDGKWMARLDAMQASAEPRLLKISGADSSVTVSNVLVGEVWVGSGQSNMAGSGGSYEKADDVLAGLIATGPYPALRIAGSGGKWRMSTPDEVKKHSALLFSFGQPLQRELNVPVGLLVGAVGGTPSGFWLSQEAYEADPACKDAIANYAKTYDYDAAVRKYEADLEKWKKADAEAKARDGKGAPGQPQKPMKAGECRGKVGNLYEKFIRPYIPYAIRGVLWDQGESMTAIQGLDQYTMMGALIRGWRKEWGQGDFPFLHVQKPSGGGSAWDAKDPVTIKADKFVPPPAQVPALGKYRESHIHIATYPNAPIVTASDLGSGIHPPNKSGYGARAARVALGAVYGRPVEYYGPLYKSCEFRDGKAVVHFTHVGQGLAVRDGEKLQGFAIAGDDKKFVWADAAIQGDTVVVSSAAVTAPVAVRYACADAHPWANLFNKDGLPALSFHTDEIPLEPAAR